MSSELPDDSQDVVDLNKAPISQHQQTLWSKLPHLLQGNDRSVKYKILMDVLPTWVLSLQVALVFLLFMIALVCGLFAIPTAQLFNQKTTPFDDSYFSAGNQIYHEVSGVSNLNYDILFSSTFYYNNSLADISKSDVKIWIQIEGRAQDPSVWSIIAQNTSIIRSLQCANDYTYYLQVPGPSGNILKIFTSCNIMTLVHLTTVNYFYYRITWSYDNLYDVWDQNMLTGDIYSTFTVTNPQFSIFETVIRSLYAGISVIFLIIFCVIIFKVQQFSKWHTTQKWLPFVLFFHIFYHDPLHWVQLLVGGAGWGVYKSLFASTFIFSFLLYLNIFIHGLFVKPSERFFFRFYLFKIILCSALWVLTNIVLIWGQLFNYANPSSVRVDEIPAFLAFLVALITLLIIYVATILYYVFRGIGNVSRFRTKYSSRFKILGSFSFFVVLSMTGVIMIQDRFRQTSEGFTFIVTHTIIFLYFSSVSLYFLPSGVVEPEAIDETPTQKAEEVKTEKFVFDEEPKINFTTPNVDLKTEESILEGIHETKVAEVVEPKTLKTVEGDMLDINFN